jgi:aspartate racemase
MKTIGLIGGMSWESTVPYYAKINEAVRDRLGGLHSAKILLYSVEFAEVERMQHEGRWDEAGALLAEVAQTLESAGADFLVLCTNTMHLVAPQIEAAVKIPLLHISAPTAEAIRSRGINTVGLLATRFTMEKDFYRARLERAGLRVMTPGERDRDLVHRVIYDELCVGRIEDASRDAYKQVMQHLVDAGAEGIILGCTEIGLLIGPDDAPVPLFDTTALHARAAAEMALT